MLLLLLKQVMLTLPMIVQQRQKCIEAAILAEQMRDEGIRVIVHAGGGSFKSQFKRADSSNASIAVILAGDELAAGVASVKMLRADAQQDGVAQVQVPLQDVVGFLKGRM